MEDAGHTPYPPPKRGSVVRKSTQLSEHARKAKEADRIANTAQTLATSLKETLPKVTTPTITKLHKREVKNSSPPLRATALFQNESLTKDIGRLRRDSVRFTPGLKSPPELMGVSSDFTELPRPTASPSITETASNGSTDRNASALSTHLSMLVLPIITPFRSTTRTLLPSPLCFLWPTESSRGVTGRHGFSTS